MKKALLSIIGILTFFIVFAQSYQYNMSAAIPLLTQVPIRLACLNSQMYRKNTQVDKDGTIKYSPVIKAVQ